MNKLGNTIEYIIKNYPYPDDLTNARLIELTHLISQRINLDINDKSLIAKAIRENNRIKINTTTSNFGTIKYLIILENAEDKSFIQKLTKNDITIILNTIDETKEMSWIAFTNHICK